MGELTFQYTVEKFNKPLIRRWDYSCRCGGGGGGGRKDRGCKAENSGGIVYLDNPRTGGRNKHFLP